MKIQREFYLRENVTEIAKDLLGKVLITKHNNKTTSGIIVETEAYNGIFDKACHAYGGKKTKRNKVMYEGGGLSYVYLCYGIHYLFNVVTNQINIPDAVLIRSIIPLDGKTTIFSRISEKSMKHGILNGPGKVTKALDINISHNAESLLGNKIWIEDAGIKINKEKIFEGPRIGIDYAGEDALLPYRFYIQKKEDLIL